MSQGLMLRSLAALTTCIGLQLVDLSLLGLTNSILIRSLKLLSYAWIVVELNAVLNSWAENRWRWTNDKSNWNWRSEVAVVTGGSAGIGACVVKKLVLHGIKVAVLDIGPLSSQFTDG
jgi:3-oxoacyl-ACP reductase-like protein